MPIIPEQKEEEPLIDLGQKGNNPPRNRWLGYSIGTKLMLGFLIASLLPLGLVVYLSARETSAALERAAFRTLFAASSQAAASIDGFIDANLNEIGMEAQLSDFVEYLSKFSQDRTIENRHRILGILNSLVRKNSIFISSYALIDLDGKKLVDTNVTHIGNDVSSRDYFKQALETGLPYVSSVEFSQITGSPSLYFSSMVATQNGEPVGVLRVRYNGAVLQQKIVSENGLGGPQSFSMLFDENDLLLAYGAVSHGGAKEYLYKTVAPLVEREYTRLQTKRRLPPVSLDRVFALSPFLEEGLSLAGTSTPHFTTRLFDPTGPLQAGAVSKMENRDWKVVFFQPKAVFLGPVQAQIQKALVLAAVIALIVALTGIGWSYFLSKPIRELTIIVKSVYAGNLSVRASVTSQDEIGMLAATFNTMTTRLSQRIEMEKLLADMSRDFIALGIGEIDQAIQHALKDIANFVNADRSYIFQFLENENLLVNTFEWCVKESLSQKDMLQAIPFDSLPWAAERIKKLQPLHVPSVKDLPREAGLEKKLWETEGTQSIISVPMVYGKSFRGVVGFASHQQERSWSQEDIRLLSMAAEIICNALERWRTEEALKNSEKRYALTQKAANIGSWEWNIVTGELHWSETIELMLGLKPGEFLKTYEAFIEMVHPDDRQLVEKSIQIALEGTKGYVVEHRVLWPNGSVRWVSEVGSVIRDDQGEPVQMLGIIQEITERKNAEDELRKHKENLEGLVKERTLELTIAKNQAEEANKAKSLFFANMSHELRTPLNAILGFSQIFKNKIDLPASIHEGVNIIQNSGEHLLSLINDILDSSKIEAGKMELNYSPVILTSFFGNIAGIIKSSAAQKKLDFQVRKNGNLPLRINADGTRLRQILLNLLNNAIKFTRTGKIRLNISALAAKRSGETVINFKVSDTGIGIAQDQLIEIFQPFVQAKEARLKIQGTGLGLSISRQLVNLMGGDLTVSSVPGKGTTFEFTLIFQEMESEASMSQDMAIDVLGYKGEQKTILVVDDNPANRSMLTQMLKPLGFKVIQAETGKQAIAIAAAEEPDLIFMDLIMPEISGIEATRQIRQQNNTRQIPIVACSASTFEEDHRLSIKAGCNYFLAKPVSYSDMQLVLKKYLKINWQYEKAVNHQPGLKKSEKLMIPETEKLKELYALAQYGNMRKISQWSQKIAAEGPEYLSFCKQIQVLAKKFQEQEIVNWVGQLLKKKVP